MNRIWSILVAMALPLAMISCERDDPDKPIGDPVGGKGGKAALNVTAKHHIEDCMVYIKYNATSNTGSFDDSVKCVEKDGRPIGTFSDLKAGSYYLYASGYDPDIAETVKGGLQFTVTEEKSYDLYISVTEPHQ
jgi:hypothetical protein